MNKTIGTLVLRFAALSVAVVLTMALILVALPYRGDTYFSVFSIKHARLDKTPFRRLIIVGGSNANFGYHSAEIEAESHYHPVNMGIHAELGLVFMLEEVRSKSRRGDAVVVSPEYHQFVGEQMYGGVELGTLCLMNPDALGYISSPKQVLNILRAIPKRTQDVVYSYLRTPSKRKLGYSWKDFNEFGDTKIDAGYKVPDRNLRQKMEGGLNPDATAALNAFAREQHTRGVAVYLNYPAIPEEFYEANREFLEALHRGLEAGLEFPILALPADRAYPVSHFYDTVYHLRTNEARAENTRRLIEDLESHSSK